MNAMESHKSLYDLVVVDSKGIEMDFANQLESRNEVAAYTKLPNGFYIDSRLESTIQTGQSPSRKEVLSTSILWLSLKAMPFRAPSSEESKIECARRHFKAISDNGYIYDVAKDYKSLYDIVTK